MRCALSHNRWPASSATNFPSRQMHVSAQHAANILLEMLAFDHERSLLSILFTFFSLLLPQILRQLPYFARPVCDCARDKRKKRSKNSYCARSNRKFLSRRQTFDDQNHKFLLNIFFLAFCRLLRLWPFCCATRGECGASFKWCSAEKWQTAEKNVIHSVHCCRWRENKLQRRVKCEQSRREKQFESFVRATKLFETFNS